MSVSSNRNIKSRVIIVTRFERTIVLVSENEVSGHQVETYISEFEAMRIRYKHTSEKLTAFGAFMDSKGFKSLPYHFIHEI